MKKIFNFMLIAACSISFVACQGEGEKGVTSDKEAAFEKVMKPYVENTVIATYSGMATEGVKLLEQCEQINEAVQAGNDYSALIKDAGETWRAMRKYWEQSEAFLFGPAEKHNIDPHIDSWPLDFNAMNALLNNEAQMKQIEEEGGEYVGDKLGYALKGFHAAEYLLFSEGQPHATDLTKAQAIYLVGIVEDLAQQAILLEDCWAGEVSKDKEAVITDDEGESMSYGEDWGSYFVNAGHPGSVWVTYQEAAEQIIEGCVDIAGEVADLKLGNPYRGDDPDYLESPYSRTSTIDFQDNIISIRNAYSGAKKGDAAIADYVKQQDSDLNDRVIKTIDEAIELIAAINDFEINPTDAAVGTAIDKVDELATILDKEVLPLLSK